MSNPLFSVRDLQKWYPVRSDGILSGFIGQQRYLKAVDDISFDIQRGDIVGLAGQSGCGKSTLGELLVRLQKPTGGEIIFEGKDIAEFDKAEQKEFRRRCQIIFQDPYESLNPRYTVGRSVAEPLVIHGMGGPDERDQKTIEALRDAGLTPPEKFIDQLPSELSGGQRQRVAIARALVLDPDFLVADEPVSMLDVSVSTGLLNRFKKLQQIRDLTMIYISHDLATIKYLTDKTMIMYLGNIIEAGATDSVIQNPTHPYTESLLASVPDPDPDTERTGSEALAGEVPSAIDLPDGCRFEPYCQYATEECAKSEPELESVRVSHDTACYHPLNMNNDNESE
jgi:peptide/nickel transport system ATP-binding protein